MKRPSRHVYTFFSELLLKFGYHPRLTHEAWGTEDLQGLSSHIGTKKIVYLQSCSLIYIQFLKSELQCCKTAHVAKLEKASWYKLTDSRVNCTESAMWGYCTARRMLLVMEAKKIKFKNSPRCNIIPNRFYGRHAV